MNKYISAKLCLGGLALLTVISGQTVSAADAPKTDSEKIGYALGMNIGSNVKKMQEQLKVAGLSLDVDNLLKGMKDTVGGGASALTTEEARTILSGLQEKVQTAQAANMKDLGEKNIKAGQDFLDQNKSKPGVTVLPDGLQYKILKAGTGPKPKPTDTFVANYRLTFVDGREVEASKPGDPLKLPVTQVIPGWTEILQLMPIGSKWQVYIPSALAYGERGSPPTIPPNTTLVFDLELLSVEPATAPAVPPFPKTDMPK